METREHQRLELDRQKIENWKRWGTYLSERQWGTVREDYSHDGNSWSYFPHDHSRSRAYRWGEDGLLGWTDRQCRICFSFAFWNEKDPILKERLFGLTGPEGNHGEDVKEQYYYLDATPTHSYAKALYKYPQCEFPYQQLVEKNRSRSRLEDELELSDLDVFSDNRFFDCQIEYAKTSPDETLIRLKVTNRGPTTATLHVLPTVWFRNTWSWLQKTDSTWTKPNGSFDKSRKIALLDHEGLDTMGFAVETVRKSRPVKWLFTENETNQQALYGIANSQPFVKDAFHRYLIHDEKEAVNSAQVGTKIAGYQKLILKAGQSLTMRARLAPESKLGRSSFGEEFDQQFAERVAEADEFYQYRSEKVPDPDQRNIQRQADAGLLWTKQFYYYAVDHWLDGDPHGPQVPMGREKIRNTNWRHIHNRDILSMPDKWEYPWYAAWDSAFHMIPFAKLDSEFAKDQLILFLREWYMHPNGQIPAYEWALDDVNPPVHAWACWEVYRRTFRNGKGDRVFLARVFNKLLLNFTWWVNRKDVAGKNLFSGGFLGLDNIGIFDRSKPLPTGGYLEQADGTAWMAFFAASMLTISLELAEDHPAYGDLASKFFEHFISIAVAMNSLDGTGLWDEEDGFYYDHLHVDGQAIPLRIRSLVGLIPLFAATILVDRVVDGLPGFKKRMNWYLENHSDFSKWMSYFERDHPDKDLGRSRLLALPSPDRLHRMLNYMLDENEFLSPFGIRSLSRIHLEQPYIFEVNGEQHRVAYVPGESDTWMFGGNSNWRGPIWFPLNFLIIQALRRYHVFYGDSFQIECPTGSGKFMTLEQVANEIRLRLIRLFEVQEGCRPCHVSDSLHSQTDADQRLVLFYEYFHGDTGRGCGASHQTGWTALVSSLIDPPRDLKPLTPTRTETS